jgi:membrane fusion protein, heavy metal efflux system
MPSRPLIFIIAFAAGAAIVAFTPGLSTTLQRAVGISAQTKPGLSQTKPDNSESTPTFIPMGDEQIKLAQIELANVGPATIAKRLVVPGTVVGLVFAKSHESEIGTFRTCRPL